MIKQKLWDVLWLLFKAGGWFPAAVFVVHLFIKYVVRIYSFWPRADVPLHFIGGLSIAFFISGAYQLLPQQPGKRSRVVLLELVLIVSLTATAAVFWEFGEFASDQLLGTNVQVSLVNTMQDLLVGMSAAFAFSLWRAWQLNAGMNEVKELVSDMSG